jgi:hypothetical protein
LLAIVARGGSSISAQLAWLFAFSDLADPGFSVNTSLDDERNRIEFTSRFILESIGIVSETVEEDFLDDLLERFGHQFPSTREFSAYARSTVDHVDPIVDADAALMAWMEREELLFRTLEAYLISERLYTGFKGQTNTGVNVDAFLAFSLSVQNRRKIRVGLALENHVETIFKTFNLSYERSAVTENKSKPDFLFPGAKYYADSNFDSHRLTMLGVKSTCKDRWRQVLAEADRIERKHLLTLEGAISSGQTGEMESKGLQLVLPLALHATFLPPQRGSLMTLNDFIGLVRSRQ